MTTLRPPFRNFRRVLGIAACTILWTACGSRERVLLSGHFHSVTHKGTGLATLVELPDGRRRLRLLHLNTYPSPDLQICLSAAPDAEDNATVVQSGIVCMGAFDAKKPAPWYEVPASLDLNRFRAVVVWNRSYRVNFTTAPLDWR